MKLKIRTKVTLGILFLFIEFVVIGIISLYYFSSINNSTELMIKNNYKSVQYAENMVQAIDEIHVNETSSLLNKLHHCDESTLSVSFKKFEENLKLEEANVTEYGEKDLAQSIGQKYLKYKSIVSNQKHDSISDKANFYFVNVLPLYNELKSKLFSVSSINMQSIIQKNDNLNDMVKRVYKNLSVILALCFLITFSFMYNFPSYIARPIKEIIERIQGLASNKYDSPIQFTSKDEFKQLNESFKYLTNKLEEKFQPVIIEKQVVKEEKPLDEKIIIHNIQSVLSSVHVLIGTLHETKNNESLQNQANSIKNVEEELKKLI